MERQRAIRDWAKPPVLCRLLAGPYLLFALLSCPARWRMHLDTGLRPRQRLFLTRPGYLMTMLQGRSSKRSLVSVVLSLGVSMVDSCLTKAHRGEYFWKSWAIPNLISFVGS